tara:strand:- start:3026 stop:3268 length:243 start_codon:yes stop_codon:yes gene_type:complete
MKKPEDYILGAAKQKQEATKMLTDEIKKVNGGFEDLINKAAPEDQAQAMKTVAEAQGILEQVRKGGDINTLVSQLQKLKI